MSEYMRRLILPSGTNLYRLIVGIPMGTTCDPLKADLFLYRSERNFMDFLHLENQADVNEAFNWTSRYIYIDDFTNINVMRQSACLVFNP